MKLLTAWLIPPLLGVATWAAVRSVSSSPGPSMAKGASPKAPSLRLVKIEDQIASFQQEWTTREATRKGPDLPGDPEKLRALAHTLIASIAQFEQQTGDGEITAEAKAHLIQQRAQLSEAARKLGRLQQGEALEWILSEAPELRIEVMAGWAEVNPASALERVIASTRMEPCSRDTLFQMLEACSTDGKSLRETAERVPWAIFAFSPVEHDARLALPENADPALWVNSGTAQWLSTQGVSAGNLFYNWAELQPDDALAAWETWPSVSPESAAQESAANLNSLLAAGVNNADSREAMLTAIRRLPEEKQVEISRLMIGSLRDFPDTYRRFATAYPELFPSAPAK